ncbi:phage terminase small subunit [Streptomyces misionensis]|uniref:phage terminase small subunit n=1 Tax=Streptomyces misionensis TaxID=67331 RepID=UPI0036740556
MTRGPAPKPNAVRRNAHPGAQELAPDVQPGRELPKALGITSGGGKRFWRTWSQAPQTATWVATDWAELEITTKLVDEFFKGDTKLAGEIRQRVAKWGATVEDRNRLRMKIEDPENEPENEAPAGGSSEAQITDEELYKMLSQ